jgi:hypothetical protein
MPSPLESDKEPIGAESKTSQLEEARDLSAAVSKKISAHRYQDIALQ